MKPIKLVIALFLVTIFFNKIVFAEIPKVSIIVPVYKVELYLDECLQSLIQQTLKDIQIICINDESPDGSLIILERYAAQDHRIIIINQKNSGPSAARNAGLTKSTGEYIGFVDSDDWIELNTFAKLYEIAKKYNADIVKFRVTRTDSGEIIGKKDGECIEVSNPGGTARFFTDIPIGFMPDKIVKSSIVKDHNIYLSRELKWFEDTTFWLECYGYANCVVSCPENFYYYRIHAGSLTDPRNTITKSLTLEKSMQTLSRKFLKTPNGPTYIKELFMFNMGWALKILSSIDISLTDGLKVRREVVKKILEFLSSSEFKSINIARVDMATRWRWENLSMLLK